MSGERTAFVAEMRSKALAAMRETVMALEFTDQMGESIEAESFQPKYDSDIQSAESALITVTSLVEEMREILDAVRKRESEASA